MASGTIGTLAARPAAGTADRFYYATDTRELFRDTGAVWEEILVSHADLSDVTANQHHASSHTHTSHTGIGATDHHSNANDHAQDSDIVVVTFFIENPVDTDDQAFHRVPFAATLLQVDYLCVGGTNWVGQVEEADTNGLNAVATQAADTTATAGTNAQVTSFSNASLASGAYLKLRSTSISGTPTSLVVTIQYRKA